MAGPEIKATVDIGQILIAGLTLLAEYKRGRNDLIAKGDPTTPTGQLKTDKELIDLMGLDADALVAHNQELIARYKAEQGLGPAQPAGAGG